MSEQYGQELSPSEIVMLQLEIRELRENVIKLERDNFLLNDQNKKLIWSSQTQD